MLPQQLVLSPETEAANLHKLPVPKPIGFDA